MNPIAAASLPKLAIKKNVRIAHIYPVSMTKHIDGLTTRKYTWEYLAMFYPRSEIDAWRNALLKPGKTEVLENLISMSQTES